MLGWVYDSLMLCAWTTERKNRKTREKMEENIELLCSFDYQVGVTIKCKVCAFF